MKDRIAREIKDKGWLEIDRKIVDEIFPHSERLRNAEMDDMITLALVGNIPPPKIADSQEKQLADWCEQHGFRFEFLFERPVLRVWVNVSVQPPAGETPENSTPQ